jgi:hypothetical protein
MACAAPYPTLASVNASTDVTNILVYANQLTCGVLSPMILFAFWCVVCFGSYFMQIKLTGFGRFQNSFAVASFLTFGLVCIMLLKTGLADTYTFLIILGVNVVAIMWLWLTSDDI